MTIITKGMGAIIKGITKGTKKKKSLLDITPRKISKNINKDLKDAAKDISKLGDSIAKTTGKLVTNKTVGAGAIAGGTSAVVRNEKKKKKKD